MIVPTISPIDSRSKPDYGLDGPPIIRRLAGLGAVAVATAIAVEVLGRGNPVVVPMSTALLTAGIILTLNAAGMVYYSRVRKPRSRGRLLDLVPWRGDEMVLDVGCGRGLLLVGAARRLTTGRAVGVDVWRDEDQSGNRPEAALENARREGVADRIEVCDGDARDLPFADASFDLVLSSLTLHNISGRDGRRRAVREIARVLRPGGWVMIVDILHTADYARTLRDSGLAVERISSGWLTWLVLALSFGGIRRFRVVGTKPTQAAAA